MYKHYSFLQENLKNVGKRFLNSVVSDSKKLYHNVFNGTGRKLNKQATKRGVKNIEDLIITNDSKLASKLHDMTPEQRAEVFNSYRDAINASKDADRRLKRTIKNDLKQRKRAIANIFKKKPIDNNTTSTVMYKDVGDGSMMPYAAAGLGIAGLGVASAYDS